MRINLFTLIILQLYYMNKLRNSKQNSKPCFLGMVTGKQSENFARLFTLMLMTIVPLGVALSSGTVGFNHLPPLLEYILLGIYFILCMLGLCQYLSTTLRDPGIIPRGDLSKEEFTEMDLRNAFNNRFESQDTEGKKVLKMRQIPTIYTYLNRLSR